MAVLLWAWRVIGGGPPRTLASGAKPLTSGVERHAPRLWTSASSRACLDEAVLQQGRHALCHGQTHHADQRIFPIFAAWRIMAHATT